MIFGRKKKEEAPAPQSAEPQPETKKKKGWFSRLRDGLSKSRNKITSGIDEVIEAGPEEPPAPEPEAAPEPAPEAPTPKPLASKPKAQTKDEPEPAAKPKKAKKKPPEAIAAPAPEPVAQPRPEPEPEIELPPVTPPEVDTALLSEPEPASAPEAAPAPAQEEAKKAAKKPGFAARIARFVRRRKLDEAALEEIEDVLIMADLGPAVAARLAGNLGKSKFDKAVSSAEVRQALAEDIAGILGPVARPLRIDPSRKPHVVLVVGVNGSGKTTTIGKLAKQYVGEKLKVSLAAGDTFRAAAVEQLQIWGERAGAPVLARATGADAAGLAFDALKDAAGRGDDVLLIDTAGRLQNKADLMAELEKIVRVIKKLDDSAPHSVLLVLDATIGQNAHSQVEVFRDLAGVTGLIVTKLDGSAKGGVIVALAERFGLPIHCIGVGEGEDDMRPFEPTDFARSLMGLED
ncbi:MAG: signal recognition particle-docking protein FtsY [Alphaproteobacteria bacterium]